MEFRDKHALVTGGSRGIGAGIARALHDGGARVSVVSRSGEAPVGFGTTIDVADEGSVAAAFARCRATNGPIDILINNAGISESAPLAKTTSEMFARILATNLTGTFYCTRDALADMRAQSWGRILNVASTAGLGGAPYISAYCASKHGVVGFTRAIAAELAKTAITCNALCPGYTDTDMMQQAVTNVIGVTHVDAAQARAMLAAMNPEGRIASVDEVCESALTLLRGEKNGVALVVPGGQEA